MALPLGNERLPKPVWNKMNNYCNCCSHAPLTGWGWGVEGAFKRKMQAEDPWQLPCLWLGGYMAIAGMWQTTQTHSSRSHIYLTGILEVKAPVRVFLGMSTWAEKSSGERANFRRPRRAWWWPRWIPRRGEWMVWMFVHIPQTIRIEPKPWSPDWEGKHRTPLISLTSFGDLRTPKLTQVADIIPVTCSSFWPPNIGLDNGHLSGERNHQTLHQTSPQKSVQNGCGGLPRIVRAVFGGFGPHSPRARRMSARRASAAHGRHITREWPLS